MATAAGEKQLLYNNVNAHYQHKPAKRFFQFFSRYFMAKPVAKKYSPDRQRGNYA